MRRVAFTLACGLSLLVCAAAVALWVRSYWAKYSASYDLVAKSETAWMVRSWGVVLEPSCIFVRYETEFPWPSTVYFSGPRGEGGYIPAPSPREGWSWYGDVPGETWDSALDRRRVRWELMRFAWARGDGAGRSVLLVIPLYALVLLGGIVPVAWARRALRRRAGLLRAAMGLCERCGYDLRESPYRCPECGTPRGQKGETRLFARDQWREWLLAVLLTTGAVVAMAVPAVLLLWWGTPPPMPVLP